MPIPGRPPIPTSSSKPPDHPPLADWQLPQGVSRSLWEFAQARHIPREEEQHLAGSSLLELDRQLVERWLVPPGRVADLGCGTGRMLIPLAERGFEVVGIDLSPESLKMAAERANAANVRVSLLQANLCDLTCLAAKSFDSALLMFATLGMVSGRENRLEVLRQARRLLKPGGQLILYVHSIWSQRIARAGRRWLAEELLRRLCRKATAGDTYRDYRGIPGMYHHLFTRRELLALLQSGGFEPTEVVSMRNDADVGAASNAANPPKQNRWLSATRIADGWIVHARAV